MGLLQSLKHAWNAFTDWDQNYQTNAGMAGGGSFRVRPDRVRLSYSNERSIVSSILNRLSLDAASIQFSHVRCDQDGRYQGDVRSGLNDCLQTQANTDQFAQQFMQDVFMTMFDKGVVAIVPIDTTTTPINSNAYDVLSMRAGEVVGWMPGSVRVNVYNEAKGLREQIILPKNLVAIVENPFYEVMNEQSSTLQRLVRKLNMLDAVDEASSSGKLDLIVQLPYVVKSPVRRQQAEQRRKDIEVQLKGSQYGIAYIDGTEKVTQLNRPADNNLLAQIDYLTAMLYSQLGVTDTIMNGTADEATMNNYYARTVEVGVRAVVQAMRATFLSKTARTQGQSIMYFRDLFALVPMSDIAKITDMMSRNEILTANDIRTAMGIKPSKDPKADQLNNSNMPTPAPVAPDPKAPFPPSSRQILPSHLASPRPFSQLAGTGGNSQNGT